MPAFYNEIDPYAAQWLRNLIAAGHIAPGVVDERSIEDIEPHELFSYTQCHFFAGIGVWSRALRLAGWPDDRPVWTGSCPCQPFSAAGKGAGFADERHLWPAWHHLIRECDPAVLFGEQVASKDSGPWLDLVQDDLEDLGYAFGAVPFPAAGVGAPHIRDRLYFVADAGRERGEPDGLLVGGAQGGGGGEAREQRLRADAGSECVARGVAHAGGAGLGSLRGREVHPRGAPRAHPLEHHEGLRVVADADGDGFWSDADWIPCRDGKARPVEPGTFPLAHGATARVGRLRAYGNAIVAPAAAEFIGAYLDGELA
jgi:DNA (cytosine-5)-methyltransferase 1